MLTPIYLKMEPGYLQVQVTGSVRGGVGSRIAGIIPLLFAHLVNHLNAPQDHTGSGQRRNGIR